MTIAKPGHVKRRMRKHFVYNAKVAGGYGRGRAHLRVLKPRENPDYMQRPVPTKRTAADTLLRRMLGAFGRQVVQ